MQPRFDKRVGATPYSLVEQARFRAAFDFMRLRADVGEVSEAIAEWWQEFSTADDLRRQDLLDQVREEQKPPTRTRVRAKPAPRTDGTDRADAPGAVGPERDAPERDDTDEAGDSAGAVPPDGEAPRKRRRRRKPRTGGAMGGAGDGGAA